MGNIIMAILAIGGTLIFGAIVIKFGLEVSKHQLQD